MLREGDRRRLGDLARLPSVPSGPSGACEAGAGAAAGRRQGAARADRPDGRSVAADVASSRQRHHPLAPTVGAGSRQWQGSHHDRAQSHDGSTVVALAIQISTLRQDLQSAITRSTRTPNSSDSKRRRSKPSPNCAVESTGPCLPGRHRERLPGRLILDQDDRAGTARTSASWPTGSKPSCVSSTPATSPTNSNPAPTTPKPAGNLPGCTNSGVPDIPRLPPRAQGRRRLARPLALWRDSTDGRSHARMCVARSCAYQRA